MSPLPYAISIEQILAINGPQEFNEKALQIFYYQKKNNAVYNAFLNELGRPDPRSVDEIPCLPIAAFKHHRVISGDARAELTFASSGTTGQERSRHHLVDVACYEQSFIRHFEQCYGPLEDLCILGLLPSYLEQGDSSLVYMVDELIARSGYEYSGTYLNEYEKLGNTLIELQKGNVKTVLIGVSYALLDFAERSPITFPELIVMETGG